MEEQNLQNAVAPEIQQLAGQPQEQQAVTAQESPLTNQQVEPLGNYPTVTNEAPNNVENNFSQSNELSAPIESIQTPPANQQTELAENDMQFENQAGREFIERARANFENRIAEIAARKASLETQIDKVNKEKERLDALKEHLNNPLTAEVISIGSDTSPAQQWVNKASQTNTDSIPAKQSA